MGMFSVIIINNDDLDRITENPFEFTAELNAAIQRGEGEVDVQGRDVAKVICVRHRDFSTTIEVVEGIGAVRLDKRPNTRKPKAIAPGKIWACQDCGTLSDNKHASLYHIGHIGKVHKPKASFIKERQPQRRPNGEVIWIPKESK